MSKKIDIPQATLMNVESLQPHPRNYREHPIDQVNHIAASMKQHGMYRNVVVSSDKFILAGHGVVAAAKTLGMEKIKCVKLPVKHDDPRAIKLLAADNETARFAEIDDRELSELLREIRDFDEFGLEGTGFDDMQLATFLMVTRPASEIKGMDEAAEWLGMPDYEPQSKDPKLIVNFRSVEDRVKFAQQNGLSTGDNERQTWSTYWPATDKDDVKNVMFEG